MASINKFSVKNIHENTVSKGLENTSFSEGDLYFEDKKVGNFSFELQEKNDGFSSVTLEINFDEPQKYTPIFSKTAIDAYRHFTNSNIYSNIFDENASSSERDATELETINLLMYLVTLCADEQDYMTLYSAECPVVAIPASDEMLYFSGDTVENIKVAIKEKGYSVDDYKIYTSLEDFNITI